MDAELVLDVAHVDTAVAFVVDEHRQTASVLGALFAAGEDEVDVGIAVGDEALHAVQTPAVLLLVEGGLEHHALQVGACVGLGEVHTHGLTGADARDVFLALLLAAKLIEGVDAALQAPDVLEAGIGGSHQLAGHREDDVGQVESAVATWHRYSIEACEAGLLQVLDGLGGIHHAVVLQVRTLEVDALGVHGQGVGGHVTRDFQHAAVVLHRVLEVHGGIVDALLGILVILFSQINHLFHLGMREVECYFRMIAIIVYHNLVCFLGGDRRR